VEHAAAREARAVIDGVAHVREHPRLLEEVGTMAQFSA